MNTYKTIPSSPSPLYATIENDGDACTLTFSGEWNWTTSQPEVTKALEILDASDFKVLNVDCQNLAPNVNGRKIFGTAFVAELLLLYRIARRHGACIGTITLSNAKQIEFLHVAKLSNLFQKHLIFSGDAIDNHVPAA